MGTCHFLCTPTTFFFLGGALIVEINSLIFKNPVLKKNNEEEVPIDFILFAILLQCVVFALTVFFCQ